MKAIPYGRQNIDKDDISAVVEVLKSDFLTQGPKVYEFEQKFAEYVGSEFAVAVCNATSALHLSVLALGLKRGERVITTPITFAATANSIRYLGGEVWLADIDPDTYLLSLKSTRELIESKPKGFFKGIIPVDFGGLPIDLEKFRELANEHGLWIVEDACHAPGGYFIESNKRKNMCGSAKYSDIATFSFHPVKHISCGEGGMVTTNNEDVYNRIKNLRTHGITKENNLANQGGWYYEMNELGYNYRLTDIQSALGISQLSKNEKNVIRRNEIADEYKRAFKNKIKFQSSPKNFYNAHHLFVIEVDNRKYVYDFLKKNNILSQIHYIPLHYLPYYKKIGYESAALDNSENYYSRCISLPIFPTLENEQQEYIINMVLSSIK